MKYLLIADICAEHQIKNLLNDANSREHLPQGVETIGMRTWIVDEKAFKFCADMVSNAESRRVKLSVFRIEDDSRIL